MSTIQELTDKLTVLDESHSEQHDILQEQLQSKYNLVFDQDAYLKSLVSEIDSDKAVYDLREDGLYLTTSIDVSDYSESIEYLESWFSDQSIYLENDILMLLLGDDFIAIQDNTRHNNGVWCNREIIICENEYKSEGEDVDETLRNKLIEEYMEKTGCFPSVGRVTQHGDFFPVNTQVRVSDVGY